MVDIKIEWDPLKASTNLKKHGVSFEDASTAFSDDIGDELVFAGFGCLPLLS